MGWWCWIDAVVHNAALEQDLPEDKVHKAVDFAFWLPGIIRGC
jgi:hypothetical protein